MAKLIAPARRRTEPNFWYVVKPVGAEFLFVLLPLIVLTFVHLSWGEKTVHSVLESAEWSFGASVLFGQAIVKLVSGATRQGSDNWGTIVLIVSLVLVLGLVPSLVILAMILLHEPPSITLVVEQLVFFVAGSVAFFLLGAIGHYGLHHGD